MGSVKLNSIGKALGTTVSATAIAALMPKRQGSQLRILVSESNGGIQAVTEGIRANLDKALEAAQQSGALQPVGK